MKNLQEPNRDIVIKGWHDMLVKEVKEDLVISLLPQKNTREPERHTQPPTCKHAKFWDNFEFLRVMGQMHMR